MEIAAAFDMKRFTKAVWVHSTLRGIYTIGCMAAAFKYLGESAPVAVFAILAFSHAYKGDMNYRQAVTGAEARFHWLEALTKRYGQWELARGEGGRHESGDEFWQGAQAAAAEDIGKFDRARVDDIADTPWWSRWVFRPSVWRGFIAALAWDGAKVVIAGILSTGGG